MPVKNSAASAVAVTSDREIVLTRVFDATRELVWRAWTDPQHIVKWWGPNGFTDTIERMDVRPGGVWKHVMHGPDGTDYANDSRYLKVVKPERLVYSLAGGKKDAPATSAEVTVTFEEQGSKTKLTLRMLFPSAEACDTVVKTYGAIEGGNQTLARLAEFLPQLSQLVLTRVFDAPRDLVWKAWTDSKHLAQWWGPRGYSNPLCEVDVRAGGAMRIDMRAPDGTVYPIRGEFKEVIAPERLVFLERVELPPGSAGAIALEDSTANEPAKLWFQVLNTITFAEEAGKTRITLDVRMVGASAGTAPFIPAGMDAGYAEMLDRLEAFVAKA
jgi:uncharacterized protein YndB with AHSA1/START domain